MIRRVLLPLALLALASCDSIFDSESATEGTYVLSRVGDQRLPAYVENTSQNGVRRTTRVLRETLRFTSDSTIRRQGRVEFVFAAPNLPAPDSGRVEFDVSGVFIRRADTLAIVWHSETGFGPGTPDLIRIRNGALVRRARVVLCPPDCDGEVVDLVYTRD